MKNLYGFTEIDYLEPDTILGSRHYYKILQNYNENSIDLVIDGLIMGDSIISNSKIISERSSSNSIFEENWAYNSFKDNLQSNANITQIIKKQKIESFKSDLQSNTNITQIVTKQLIESFKDNISKEEYIPPEYYLTEYSVGTNVNIKDRIYIKHQQPEITNYSINGVNVNIKDRTYIKHSAVTTNYSINSVNVTITDV